MPISEHFCDFRIFHFVSKYVYDYGTLEATRTPDPQLRRLLLYPTELRGHSKYYNRRNILIFQIVIDEVSNIMLLQRR